jgi:photosystem II stability/assembly factor-like uncharacterized protein
MKHSLISHHIKLILGIVILFSDAQVNSQWMMLNSGTTQNLNAIHFLNINTGFAAGTNGTAIMTTNGGSNWITLNTGSSLELRDVHFFNPQIGILCGFNGLILRTSNSGNNWNNINSGTTNHLLGLSFFNDSIGVCPGNSGTILYTTNGGLNWATGQPTGYMVTFYSAFMVNASTGYAAGVNTIFSPLIAKTTNGGAAWTYYSFYVNNNEATLNCIYFFDVQNGIAVSNLWNGQGGISFTTNSGLNWSSQIFPYALTGVDFPSPLIGYSVGANGYILKSSDGGNTWSQQISGTTVLLKSVDFIDSLNGYATGYGGTILKTTNGGITSVTKKSREIPAKYILYQNYPNPFNPSTKIKFQIPSVGQRHAFDVRLVIYDLLGHEVATLIPPLRGGHEGLQPGTYEVEWDASNYPSGVYFYKLETEYFTQTKKLILLK